MRTARRRGRAERGVLRRHVLRNALLPRGRDARDGRRRSRFGGAIFVETVFGLPGLGQLLYEALARSDLPVILGVVIVVSVAVAIANLVADIVYALLDPRVRFESPASRSRAVAAAACAGPRAGAEHGVSVASSHGAQACS